MDFATVNLKLTKPNNYKKMKSINKLAVVALLALASVGSASATTVNVIHVTGSTAFRVADVTAEVSYLNGLGSGGVTAAFVQAAPSLPSQPADALTNTSTSVIYGPVVSGVQTVFENAFNGSIIGTEQATCNGSGNTPAEPKFMLASYWSSLATAVTVGNSTTPASGGYNPASGSTSSYTYPGGSTENVQPDIAFADVFNDAVQQIIGNFNTSYTQNLTPSGTTASQVVGIIPFVFVCTGSTDVTSKLSGLDMDPQKFTQLWNNGTLPLSFFTGSTGDSTITAYALGRDVDSGTRGTALMETGFGLNGSGNAAINNEVTQYFPYDNSTDANNDQSSSTGTGTYVSKGEVGDSSAPVIGYMNPVPPDAVGGYSMPEGDGGYNSGGNLAIAFCTPFSGLTNTALFTYLGVFDAQNALAVSSNKPFLMSYNGVTFNPTVGAGVPANVQAIESGKYTFWGYEHMFTTTSSSAPSVTAAAQLKSLLLGGLDQLASAGVPIASMQVERTDDGEPVTKIVGTNPY